MSIDWIGGAPPSRERADPASRVPLRSPLDGRAQDRGLARRALVRNAAPAFAPDSAVDQWVPLGPSDTMRGQADLHPRISGRVRALAVSDDGARIYAGTAQGGVWYSGDAGRRWVPLDFYATTPTLSGELGEANALAVGSVLVRFDPGGDAARDLVYAGTGEQRHSGFAPLPGEVQGVGVRVAVGPAAAVAAGPDAADWKLEATNIAGAAVLRMAFDRRDPGIVWAATSRGLFRRAPVAVGVALQWLPVALPFVGDVPVTDVLVTRGRGSEPQRIYIGSNGDLVAWSVTGDAGSWKVTLLPPHPEHSGDSLEPIARTALAEGNPHGDVLLWVLGGGPRLWRIGADDDLAGVVTGLPRELFEEQSVYDMAIAVDPAADHPNRIVVGGETVESEPPHGMYNAALYCDEVTPGAPGRWEFPGGGDDLHPSSFIGSGVHADVHDIAWVPGAPGAGSQMWVACDGGVFCSDEHVPFGSFGSRNRGMATLEAQYLAQHPTSDAIVIAGTQDNGTIRRLGDETWTVVYPGDGGGVAIDPLDPRRVVIQYTNTEWVVSTDGGVTVRDLAFMRSAPSGASKKVADAYEKAHTAEHDAAAFYSNAAVVVRKTAAGKDATRLAIGTDRVWLSEDWGASWVTLPSGKDPYDPARPQAPDRVTDVLEPLHGSVYVLRWATPTRLHVLTENGVFLLEQSGTTWTRQQLHDRAKVWLDTKDEPPAGRIPAHLVVTDLAPHEADRGPLGSLYAATSGTGGQHVWWFDGTDTWHPAKLPVDSPVHALAIDPGDRHIIYAGTDVGVWRGVAKFPPVDAAELDWKWTHYSNGLPEASCIDLAVHAPTRLLRAALRGRGVWEVKLDGFFQPREPYLRAHTYDTRRFTVPVDGAPDPLGDPAAPAILSLDASPDVRVFRAPGTPPPAPVALPLGGDEFDIWVAQAAGRAAGLRVEADGQWSARATAALGTGPVNLAQWNALVGPHANEPPFDLDPPDAADVAANLRDEPDRRGGTRASCATGDGVVRVFVTVHGRDWLPFDPVELAVFLLRTPFSGKADVTGHAPLPTVKDGWGTQLDKDLTATSPGAWLAGSDWSYVDPAKPFRRPGGDVDGRQAQVVTFDTTLSPWPAKDRGWLLLAVVVAEGVPFDNPETDVGGLVRARHQVAARSVRGAAAPAHVASAKR